MMRDYETMRTLLIKAGEAKGPLLFTELYRVGPRDSLVEELQRLKKERLIDSSIEFLPDGSCKGGTLDGLTDEGEEFLRLIESEDVWKICTRTLSVARVDLSYPLLKDICETIVRRYVERFIE